MVTSYFLGAGLLDLLLLLALSSAGSMLSALHILIHLILTNLYGKHNYPYFSDIKKKQIVSWAGGTHLNPSTQDTAD